MKTYLFCGNKELAQRVASMMKHPVIISTDYDELLRLEEKDSLDILVVLYSEDSALDTKGKKTGWVFNTFSPAKPGEFHADVFCPLGKWPKSLEESAEAIDAKIHEMEMLEDFLDDLDGQKAHIRYNGWLFSGGRGEDVHRFDITDDHGKELGVLLVGDSNEFDLNYKDLWYHNYGPSERANAYAFQKMKAKLMSALEKDDPEIWNAITVNGEQHFPEANYDISREEVIASDWQ